MTCDACLDRDCLCGQTNTCENITLPQTSFAGGNNRTGKQRKYHVVPTNPSQLIYHMYFHRSPTPVFQSVSSSTRRRDTRSLRNHRSIQRESFSTGLTSHRIHRPSAQNMDEFYSQVRFLFQKLIDKPLTQCSEHRQVNW